MVEADRCRRIESPRRKPTPPRRAKQVRAFKKSIATILYSGENPRWDTYDLDLATCGPMVLDALIAIKNHIDPTLTFRRSCAKACAVCAMKHLRPQYARLHQDDERTAGRKPSNSPLPSQPVLKDLVPDLSNFVAAIPPRSKPWLAKQNAKPGRGALTEPEEREGLDGLYECILCACCSTHSVLLVGIPDRFYGPGGAAAGLSLDQ